MIRILFFGPVADSVGARSMDIEFRPGLSLAEVRQQVGARFPSAMAFVSFMAVNGVQVRDPATSLDDGSEIAFMAKFSGG